MAEIKLFDNKKDCCGCGACANVCPKNAISMKEDKYGFIYPSINNELCVGCKMCQKVCAYQNKEETNVPLKTWAAVSKDKEILKGSSSGGVFTALASDFLKKDGFVSGAVFDEKFNLHHILTDKTEDLTKLQGSKYTHSNTGTVYREIKEKLKSDSVLFCGCPCQVAGLKSYLGKDYDNLITIDLICHGVPSNKIFKDYLKEVEQKNKYNIKEFKFRDKAMGWGINGSLITNHNEKRKVLCSNSSYVNYFLNCLIYRENCYSCKYACKNRTGDITIGDYWGIPEELLKKYKIDTTKGVSVIIANTEKGRAFIENKAELFDLYESEYEKAARGNHQLNAPSKYDKRRDEILGLYAEKGWKAVDDEFIRKLGFKKYINIAKGMLPAKLKKYLKKIINKF